MNKFAINLLCILIIAVMGASILIPGGGLGYYFFSGFEKGYHDADKPEEELSPYDGLFVEAVPSNILDTPTAFRDSVRFDDGRILPVTYSSVKIFTAKQEASPLLILISGLASIGILVSYVIMAVKFIKFVVHINKGEIFSHRNIRLLTWIGIFLLAIALLQTVIGIIEDCSLASMGLTLEGISFTGHWTLPFSFYLLGLLALLMSYIWRRGLMLKEEHELTI